MKELEEEPSSSIQSRIEPTLQFIGAMPNKETRDHELIVLCGPPGSGKSKIVKMLLTLTNHRFRVFPRLVCKDPGTELGPQKIRQITPRELFNIMLHRRCMVTSSVDLGNLCFGDIIEALKELTTSTGFELEQDVSDVIAQLIEKPAPDKYVSAFLTRDMEREVQICNQEGGNCLMEVQMEDAATLKEFFPNAKVFLLSAGIDVLNERHKRRIGLQNDLYPQVRKLECLRRLHPTEAVYRAAYNDLPLVNEIEEDAEKIIQLIIQSIYSLPRKAGC